MPAVPEPRANRPVAFGADERERRTFSTLNEGSLHAALKARYVAQGGRAEAIVDGFVVDVARPDEIVEVQTASLASLRRKLEILLVRRRVVLVFPIAGERWIVRVGSTGETLGRRRSPRRGLPVDAFDELVGLASLLVHSNLALDLVLIREEEVRAPLPPGVRRRYRRAWQRIDRRLIDVVETWRIEGASDLARLLPPGLPTCFTSADIVEVTGRSKRLAMRAVYVLEKAGAARRVGRRGRHAAYELTVSARAAAPA